MIKDARKQMNGACHIRLRQVTRMDDMGWRRLVGLMKLQVSFAKEPYKRDDIMQKRPIILSILLTVATPYDDDG